MNQTTDEALVKEAEALLANNIDGLKGIINDDDIFDFYRRVVIEYALEFARKYAVNQREVAEKAIDAMGRIIACNEHGMPMYFLSSWSQTKLNYLSSFPSGEEEEFIHDDYLTDHGFTYDDFVEGWIHPKITPTVLMHSTIHHGYYVKVGIIGLTFIKTISQLQLLFLAITGEYPPSKGESEEDKYDKKVIEELKNDKEMGEIMDELNDSPAPPSQKEENL